MARAAGFGYSPAYVAPGGMGGSACVANGRRILGIDEEPVTLADGRKGMKITNVYPAPELRTQGFRSATC